MNKKAAGRFLENGKRLGFSMASVAAPARR